MFAEPPPLDPEPPLEWPRPPPPPALLGARGSGMHQIWRMRDLAWGMVGMVASFAAGLLLLVIFTLTTTFDQRQSDAVELAATAIWAAGFGGLVCWLAQRRGVSWRQLGFRRPRRWALLPILVGACYAVLMAYAVAVALLDGLGLPVGWLEGGNPVEIARGPSALPLWSLFAIIAVVVLVVAPLAEEIFFRGLLFRALGERLPSFWAMGVSGFVFSAFHLNLSVLIPFTLLGMLFAWGFRTSGSIWVPIGAHAAINGVGFVATVIGALNW